MSDPRRVLAGVALLATAFTLVTAFGPMRGSAPARQEVPVVWEAAALAGFELPPPNAPFDVEHISPDYYYGLPRRVAYETYPVYHPDFEPPGYLDSLGALGPGTVLDTDTLKSEAQWLRAGELLFDIPQQLVGARGPFSAAALAAAGVPVAADGTFPFHRYVVLEGGEVRVGVAACGNCHTRVMPDGSVLKAVQGNYPLDRVLARAFGQVRAQGGLARPGGDPPIRAEVYLPLRSREQFGAPWIDHGSQAMLDTISVDRIIELHAAVPPGSLLRQGTHFFYPVKVPDLRGVRHRRFLDATGLIQQRSIGDLMRYASFTQTVDLLNRFGDFVPSLGPNPGPLPPPDQVRSVVGGPFTRFSDAELYALAKYLYSLEPLPSPYEFDEETLARGERVFIEEGCVTCHAPPDYSNHELTPALGFEPPEEHYERYPIFDIPVETDPGLTLYTRRGTGYYKVPSLRGLWYRERLFHDGSLSLEQVLDPARLDDDFVPAGFRGTDSTRAVPGHPFGLELGEREKAALLAFLKTL